MRSALLTLAAVLAGCSTPEEAACPSIDLSCTPQYEPTFENIHARSVVPGCAISGGACHQAADGSGGFALPDIDVAYDALSSRTDDQECSTLLQRLHSTDPAVQMPPGKPLGTGELCAISQWVAAGAPR